MRFYKIDIYRGKVRTPAQNWDDDDLVKFQDSIIQRVNSIHRVDLLYSLSSEGQNNSDLSLLIVESDQSVTPNIIKTHLTTVTLRFSQINSDCVLKRPQNV